MMKTPKIAVIATAVLCAISLASSCHKADEEEKKSAGQETEFTVSLNSVEASYAEIVVSHTGAKDATWFGFVTEDVTASEQDLINEQLSRLDKKSLHVGKSQTVPVRNLEELHSYLFIAFAVNEEGKAYGTPGHITFSTSPQFNVNFTAEPTEVLSHQAAFNIGHAGNPILTYTCFLTDDLITDAKTLSSSDFASNVTDGKLNEGVVLLTGNTQTVTFDGLDGESAYRLIVYGIFDNNGVCEYYGTPADCAFVTPVDLSEVEFSAVPANVTESSADVKVSYNANSNELTWYGFLTEDLTADASALIAAKVADITSDDYQKGPQTVSLTGLTANQEYRYIVTGITADGIYGTPGEIQFKAYRYVASYDDYIGTWTMTVGSNVYDFTIEKKVQDESYTIRGLNGATIAQWGIDTPLVVEGTYAGGELSIACQTISESYVDPYDGLTYVDMFCGIYTSGSSNYISDQVGGLITKFILGVDGNIEVTAEENAGGQPFSSMRFFQVGVSTDDVYVQDEAGTVLPNVAVPAVSASGLHARKSGIRYSAPVKKQNKEGKFFVK